MFCMGCGSACGDEVFTDPLTLRSYGRCCAMQEKTSSRGAFYALLDKVLPLGPGCRVECRTAGTHYDGTGVVTDVSTDLENGGTPVHPAFLVSMDGSGELVWYTEVCLTRIEEK